MPATNHFTSQQRPHSLGGRRGTGVGERNPVSPLSVQAARLSDIPQVLQQVMAAAHDRELNPQYLEWRYLVGLAKGLFATVLWRRFRDESGALPARLQVVRDGVTVLGFSLLRTWPVPSQAQSGLALPPQELYLLCVSNAHRRRGVARLLLTHATAQIAPEQTLLVNCLRKSRPMAGLLGQLGATLLGPTARQQRSQASVLAYALGCTTGRAQLAQIIRPGKRASA